MTVGQVVDFTIDFNERQKRAEKESKRQEKHGTKRKATEADIKAFFG